MATPQPQEPITIILHLITVCVGFIIAFGLQQMIEAFRRRRRITKARAASSQPTKENPDPPTNDGA